MPQIHRKPGGRKGFRGERDVGAGVPRCPADDSSRRVSALVRMRDVPRRTGLADHPGIASAEPPMLIVATERRHPGILQANPVCGFSAVKTDSLGRYRDEFEDQIRGHRDARAAVVVVGHGGRERGHRPGGRSGRQFLLPPVLADTTGGRVRPGPATAGRHHVMAAGRVSGNSCSYSTRASVLAWVPWRLALAATACSAYRPAVSVFPASRCARARVVSAQISPNR